MQSNAFTLVIILKNRIFRLFKSSYLYSTLFCPSLAGFKFEAQRALKIDGTSLNGVAPIHRTL